MAAAGSAVGLGNLWGFAYRASQGGGGAFLILYLLIVLVVCLPVLVAEMVLGRSTGQSPLMAPVKAAGPRWQPVALRHEAPDPWLGAATSGPSCNMTRTRPATKAGKREMFGKITIVKAKPAKKAAKAEAKEEPLVVMKGKRLLDGDEEFVVYKRAKQRLENDDGDDELFDGAFYHKAGEEVTSANYKDVCEWSGIVEVAEWRKAAMAADAKAEGEAKAAAAADCLLYTSPSPRDKRQSRMPSSA